MIVCFSGWKGSGKDSLADYLIKEQSAIRVGLADPLKDSVAEEFGIDRSSLDDPKRKEKPLLHLPVDPKDKFSKMLADFMAKEFRSESGEQPSSFVTTTNEGVVFYESGIAEYKTVYHTPRSLAILKGSANRFVSSDFWVKKALEVIQGEFTENPDQLIVITDIRYKSEVVQFQEHFGNKAVFIRINRFKESPSNDASERDLDDHEFDFYIDNTGTIEQSYTQLKKILAQLK